MILRKPYAFLIKNFKLIHAFMTVFMAYVFYKTLTILSVFNDYFNSGKALIGTNTAASTYTFMLFFIPVLIILLTLILFWVMLVKKKPSSLYIITIIVYIYSIVLFGIGKSVMLDMEINVLDIRLIKMARDLTTFAFIAQIYPLFKSMVRAVGFDIKEFDFGKDLAELEIEEKDSEEFEVNVSLDTNKVKRGLNFRKRELKYVIKENKVLIILVSAVVFAVLSGITLLIMFMHGNNKNTSKIINYNGLTIKIGNVYATRKDYSGKELDLNDQMTLVIVPFEVKNNTNLDKEIITANVMLDIGEHRFRNSITYRDNLSDFGIVYNGETIKGGVTDRRVFIFEVPVSYITEKTEFKFITTVTNDGKKIVSNYIRIPVNIIDLDKNNESISIEKDVSLDNTILKGSSLSIESASIAKRFKIDYKYSLSNTETMDSYEYVYAPLDTNVDKSLLKITGEFSKGDGVAITDLYDLINTYGSIKYVVGDKTKTLYTLNKVNPATTRSAKTIYIGVPSEMEKASSVTLILNIRGIEYTYKIK